MRFRRLSFWLLLSVAIFTVLAHICATPFHAHAGAVTTHAEDHPEHGSDEAAHGGSCEAQRPSFSLDAPALQATGAALPFVDDWRSSPRPAPLAPEPLSSPPLFLLHTALLI